jgi:ABC-type branched-subunit amino acid transport system substrate-binding protein
MKSRVLGLMAVGVLAVACGGTSPGAATGGDTTGVTSDSIVLGTWQPMSGPFKFYGDFQIPGMKAAIAYINAKGGVNGRKLQLALRDGGCTDSQLAVQAGRQLIEQDNAFLFFGDQCGATVNAITSTLLAGTKIQNFSITGGSRLSGPAPDLSKVGYSYFFSPDTATQILDVLNYGDKKGMLRGKKVGFLGGNDTYGADALLGVQQAAAKYGYTVSDVERVDETATNVSVEMAKIKASGADVVALSCYPQPGGGALSAALQQDYHPIFLADFAPVSFATINSLPAAAYANVYIASATSIARGSAEEKAQIAQLQPYADTTLTSDNWAGGNLLRQVVLVYLQRAGRNLTREDFLAALYKGPVQSASYGTINITGKVMNPVVVRSLHVMHYTPDKQQVIDPTLYAPEITVTG